jgi:hypothetical protein
MAGLTLQQLIDQIQNVLTSIDPDSVWPESKISEWIHQGIREYSRYFPRRLTTSITPAIVGSDYTRFYDLPADFLDVLAVEWPQDHEPPVWLARRPETESGFGAGDFDVRRHADATDPAELVLGETPTTATDKVRVHYLGLHDLTLATTDTVSVPDEDLELLIQFVKMRAYEERLSQEEKGADPTSMVLSLLGTNARAAKREFYDLVKRRQRAVGAMVQWGAASD